MIANQIICGDCVDVLTTIDSDSVDLCLFSPPYDKVREYHGFSLDFNKLGKQLFRILKDGAIAACVIGDGTKDFAKSLTSFRLAIDWVDNCGFKLFECCVYHREGRPGGWWSMRFRVDHEFILFFMKGSRPKFFDKEPLKVKAKYAGTEWHGTSRKSDGEMVKQEKGKFAEATKCRGTIWHYSASCTEGNLLKNKHPAAFPDQLAIDIVRCFSKENDLVFDPTCGSGTTCVVAANLNRKYVGIDISGDYVDIARQRIRDEVKEDIFK